MRTLVIPDIHNKFVRAEAIITHVPHDKCILLGDYFDSFGDTMQLAENTAIWLRDFVFPNKKIIPLIGNHDINYFYRNNPNFRCSGYSDGKNLAINNIWTDEIKAKFGFYHIDQGYVFSHAGLTNAKWKEMSAKFLDEAIDPKLKFFESVLSYFVEVNQNNAKFNRDADLFAAGWDRGGFHRHGGITWVDWNSFAPINGINQIVGHSRGKLPRILVQKVGGAIAKKHVLDYYKNNELVKKVDEFEETRSREHILGVSYCLDTDLNHYAVVEDGMVKIFDLHTQIDLASVGEYFIPESPMNTLT